MKKYRAVLIDIDGTLLDFEKAECRGVQAVMKLYGVVPDHNKVARYQEINQNFWRRYEKGRLPGPRSVRDVIPCSLEKWE